MKAGVCLGVSADSWFHGVWASVVHQLDHKKQHLRHEQSWGQNEKLHEKPGQIKDDMLREETRKRTLSL